MLQLRTLGSLELTDTDSRSVRSVLSQPKRAALLVYLATSAPRGFLRRAAILPLFWPESDEAAARHSLSQSLYRLRRSLGPGLIEVRGAEEVRLAPGVLRSDVETFREELARRRWHEALAVYQGDFLAAFEVEDAAGFERWIETERGCLRRAAADAAWCLAEDQLARGALLQAERSAGRALALDPANEGSARRIMQGLASAGAPASALRFHDTLRAHLASELDSEPSAATTALVHSLRRPQPRLTPAPDAHHTALEQRPEEVDPQSPLADATPGAAGRDRRRQPWLFVAGALAVLASAGFLASHIADSGTQVRSLAVLPLADLTADPEQAYLVEGFYNALLGELAQIPTLRVIPRASLLHLDTTGKSRSAIARALGVDAVIGGGVFRAGDTVRVHIELIRARPESFLWTGAYERELRDVTALHRDVAHAIAAEVQARLTPQQAERLSRALSVSPAAYDAWLRGSYHASRKRGDDLAECIRYGEQATALDPEFAEAYQLLAECHNLMAFVNASPPHEMYGKAKHAARRAIALDPGLASAHAALAYAIAHYEWDWVGAEHAYRGALALNPAHDGAHGDLAWLLSWLGRFDEALMHARRAEELNPLSPQAALRLGMTLHLARRHEEAVAQAKRAMELDPRFMFAYDRLHWAYHGLGRYDDAVSAAERAAELGGPGDLRRRAFLAHAYGFAGRTDEARAILQGLLEAEQRSYVPPTAIAAAYVGLGDLESTLDWLERGFAGRDGDMVLLRSFPLWDPVRQEPRFQTLLRRMRFPDRELQTARGAP